MKRRIADLWFSSEPSEWSAALEAYWKRIKQTNLAIEREFDRPGLREGVAEMSREDWYEFLLQYYQWKFTDGLVLAKRKRELAEYRDGNRLAELDDIRRRILALDTDDAGAALRLVRNIKGLGVAGASGLLALLYPTSFGTVDKHATEALQSIPNLPERHRVAEMKPTNLDNEDAVFLIGLYRRKAVFLRREPPA